MKNSRLMMGTAPFLAMLTFLFLGLGSAKAAEMNTANFRSASLEITQGSSESNAMSVDRKKKKKKKKKGHRCEAY